MGMPTQIRAVAFQEGDIWVVQGVDFDVVAQAKELMDAPIAFLRTVVSTFAVNQKLGRDADCCMRAAPVRFLEMFESADMELRPLGPLPTDPQIPRPDIAMRGYRRDHAV